MIIYVTSDFRKKQTVIHLPTPSENVTILTCEMQKCLIWLQVCCVLSNVGGSEGASCGLSSVSLKTTGIENVRQATSQKVFRVTTFCISICFRSFSTLISRIVHHAVLKFSPCRNKPLPQAATCPYQYTRSSCSVLRRSRLLGICR